MALYSSMTPDEAYRRDEESWNDFYRDLGAEAERQADDDYDRGQAEAAYFDDMDHD